MGLFTRTAFNHFLGVLRYKDLMAKSANLPGLRQLGNAVLDTSVTNLSYIPVFADIELPPGVVAPRAIIEHFINLASDHAIINRCPCRTAMGCEDYDRDFGCTFMGEAVRDIDPGIARQVTKDEALEHLSMAYEMGLITVIGKFKGDAIALGVRDHSKLMTVCHCCPCCCVSTSLHYAPREARDIMVRLEGLSVTVDGECSGCAKCVESCVFKQVEVIDGKARIGDECKGCGRCASACPQGAIRLKVEDSSYVDACIERISATVDIT